jgi:hypothetical protein
MRSEARAHGLQAMYQAGAVGALEALNEECTAIAVQIARSKVRRLRICVQRDRIEQIAHDASSRLMERYLRDACFHVRHFSVLLSHRVKDELFVSPRQKQQTFEARVQYGNDAEPSELELATATSSDAAIDIATSHRWGKKAVADLCRSRSYRQAIKRISAYVERRWIYEHASSLHEVYRTLHAKQGAHGRVSRSGLMAVREELLRSRRAEREPPAQ